MAKVPAVKTARRDVWLLMVARGCRAFGFGFSAVLLASYLSDRGLNATGIGATVALGAITGAVSSLLMAKVAVLLNRRRALTLAGVLMVVTGLNLAFARSPLLLVLGGLLGVLGAGGFDVGPFAAVEQAMLAEAAGERTNVLFGRYWLVGIGSGTVGSAVAVVGTSLERIQWLYLGYAALGAVTVGIPLFLSDRTETDSRGPVLTVRSFRPLLPFTGLISLDAIGSGFIVQAVVAYWLHLRFGVGPQVIGPAFALFGVLEIPTYEAAGRLANRIGQIRTMVFTHLPSNVLLALVPFAPNVGIAILILSVRRTVQSMDVPARQAFISMTVPSQERAGAVAVTGLVRGAFQAVGATLTGLAIATAPLGLPFWAAGVLKSAYDLALYTVYRRHSN